MQQLHRGILLKFPNTVTGGFLYGNNARKSVYKRRIQLSA